MFNTRERDRYPIAARTYSKPAAVLNAALDAHPLALGFVLPRPFILEKQFTKQRQRIEQLYGAVELVELPDRTFDASGVETALLIASDPRPPAKDVIYLRSTEVADRDRSAFLKTGATTTQRQVVRSASGETEGELWIPPLDLLWQHLQHYPCLSKKLRPRWGIRWNYDQEQAWSSKPQAGFRKGLHGARGFKQFYGSHSVWLDFRRENLREGFKQDWKQPKLIMNATRLSRGPWRIGAVVDTKKLLYSQQFFGLWPTAPMEEQELFCLNGILNGPIANAFLAIHSPANRFRASAVGQIPIPPALPAKLWLLVAESDIPHMPSKFVEFVPLSHRQGNCIPYAAIRWHDFGNRPALGRPLGHFSRHPDTPLLSLSPRRRFPRPTPERVFVADHQSSSGFSGTGPSAPPPQPIGT